MTPLKDRWTQRNLEAGNVAVKGTLVSRVAIPRCEYGNFTASGVEEVRGWLPSYSPRNTLRLGNPQLDTEIVWCDSCQRPTHHRQVARELPGKFTYWTSWDVCAVCETRRVPSGRPIASHHLLDPKEVKVLYLARPNGFINLGLHFILDRIFNINTPDTAIDSKGISNDTTAVVATTLLIDPTAGAGSPDFQTLGSGVGAAATSRTGNTVTDSAGWEPADFTTVFSVTKVGDSTNAADSGDDTVPTVQGVVNIIGGTGGSAPYNEPFEVNLVTVTDFDLTLQQQTTAQAT